MATWVKDLGATTFSPGARLVVVRDGSLIVGFLNGYREGWRYASNSAGNSHSRKYHATPELACKRHVRYTDAVLTLAEAEAAGIVRPRAQIARPLPLLEEKEPRDSRGKTGPLRCAEATFQIPTFFSPVVRTETVVVSLRGEDAGEGDFARAAIAVMKSRKGHLYDVDGWALAEVREWSPEAPAPEPKAREPGLADALESFGREADWGRSALSADTIRKVNEAPLTARRALRAAGRKV